MDARVGALLPTMEAPAVLDMAPGFVDEGMVAGKSAEVAEALQHWLQVGPKVWLRCSRLEVAATTADVELVRALGCTVNLDKQFASCGGCWKLGRLTFCSSMGAGMRNRRER